MFPTGAPKGVPDMLLQSGCPDCIVIKGDDIVNSLILLSKENTGTD